MRGSMSAHWSCAPAADVRKEGSIAATIMLDLHVSTPPALTHRCWPLVAVVIQCDDALPDALDAETAPAAGHRPLDLIALVIAEERGPERCEHGQAPGWQIRLV